MAETVAEHGSIEGVIWDFGGVFTPSPFEAMARFAGERQIDLMTMAELIFGDYGADTDHPWHRLERGEITMEEAGRRIDERARELAVPVTFGEALMSLSGSGANIWDDMVASVRRIRSAGLRTGLLTNNLAEIRDLWRPLLPLDELFDDVVDSSEVGCRKPSAEIYELSASRLGIARLDRLVFLDDAESNVAAARSLGMTGILVTHGSAEVLDSLSAATGV